MLQLYIHNKEHKVKLQTIFFYIQSAKLHNKRRAAKGSKINHKNAVLIAQKKDVMYHMGITFTNDPKAIR